MNERDLHFYDFSLYEWILELNGSRPFRGLFVDFAIENEGVINFYPMATRKHFAFCPSVKFQEYLQTKGAGFKTIPTYISFFNKEEIRGLQAVIPLHM